jgi:hypothetical protein
MGIRARSSVPQRDTHQGNAIRETRHPPQRMGRCRPKVAARSFCVATTFTIAGGVIEGFGLVLIFVELAIIRSHEFGVPPPWARTWDWVRRRLGLGKTVRLRGGMAVASGFEVRAKVGPGPVEHHDRRTARRAA